MESRYNFDSKYCDSKYFVLDDYSKYVNVDEIANLKDAADMLRKYAIYVCSADPSKSLFKCIKMWERVYCTCAYKDMNNVEKAIIYSNAVFPDDVDFMVKVVATFNYKYESVLKYIELLKKCNGEDFSSENIKNSQILASFINKTNMLVNTFKGNVGKIRASVIVNKLMFIVSYDKNLYETVLWYSINKGGSLNGKSTKDTRNSRK